jgi:hypothetical protein
MVDCPEVARREPHTLASRWLGQTPDLDCGDPPFRSLPDSDSVAGLRNAQQDIRVPLAPSPSRRVTRTPRYVLRPHTGPRKDAARHAPTMTRRRDASAAVPADARLSRAPQLGASRLPCLVGRNGVKSHVLKPSIWMPHEPHERRIGCDMGRACSGPCADVNSFFPRPGKPP